MTSPKLRMIERKFARTQAQEPVSPSGAGGLGAALEQLIDEQVQRQVAEQLQRQRDHLKAPRLRRLVEGFKPTTKPWQPIGEPFDPAAKPWHPEDFGPATKPAEREYVAPLKREPIEATVQRDGADRLRTVTVNGIVFKVERDSAGRIKSMVQQP